MDEFQEVITIYPGTWYRRSPFFEAASRYGCQAYDLYNRMFIPSHYDDPVNEYWHLVNHVTLWDVGVERQVEVTGPDAFAFTDMLVARDLSGVKVGQGRYVVLCDEKGGIVNDPVLLKLGENHFWLSAADSDVILWAKGAALHSGMEVDVSEPDVSPLQLQGPKSKYVARDLFGPRALDLKYYHFMETKLDGIPVVLTRTGWSAEVGYEIYLRDGSRGTELWERIMQAGKPYDIRPTGPSEFRRVEAGILNYPSDINLGTNPYEVGLERLVDLDKKGDFIGKKALRRIRQEGPRRKLVGVEVQGAPVPLWLPEYRPVVRGGRRVGHLTALVHSPRLQKNIGYALVTTEHSALGTKLVVDTPWGEREATVVPRPFIDPKKEIPRA